MTAAWIDKLNESDSRLHKEDVIRQALELVTLGNRDSELFLSFMQAAYNPLVTWGVKQIPKSSGIVDAENPWEEFSDLLFSLYSRNLTGNAARDSIKNIMTRFDSEEWNKFCVGVLSKDLRAGVSDKTINKICKGTKYEVPVFGCQLATSCEDRPEMKGKKRIEPKLDGVRVLMLCSINDANEGTITCYSRNGKIFENFGHIEEQISSVMHIISGKINYTSFILDGEVIGRSFQELMRQARRKENVNAVDSVFHIFDIIPTEDFLRGHCNMQLHKRLGLLNKISNTISQLESVEFLPHIDVDLDTAQGRDQLDRYAKDCVAQGFEGVMIKNLDAPYESKRNTFWLKWKPVITVDLEVKEIEEGTGRNSGRLGALVCSGNDHGKDITVNVGSGFSDVDRDNLWNDRNLIIGRTVEILCDTITQNQDGTYSLRFPRFVRFRDDK
jgi:DNA ligase-1